MLVLPAPLQWLMYFDGSTLSKAPRVKLGKGDEQTSSVPVVQADAVPLYKREEELRKLFQARGNALQSSTQRQDNVRGIHAALSQLRQEHGLSRLAEA